MKKFYSLLAIAMFFFVLPMGMMGENHTIGWGSATGTASTNFTATSGTVEGILSFTTAKNSSSTNPAYNANASELRLYYASNGQGGSITITPVSGITITGAVMTTSTTPSVNFYVDGGSATSVNASNSTYTISGISATQSLKIQNANTSNTQLRILTIELTYTTGGDPVIYTVTYDCNDGTGGCPENLTDVEAGTSINLAAAPEKTGYSFNGWSDGTNIYQVGDPYTVNDDVTFTAQWVEEGVFVFNLSSNPGNWPTTQSSSLEEYTYTLNNVDYTFALVNVKCTNGYLMIYSVGALGLPAIEGYKLTRVVASNASGCSTAVKVGISSSASQESYIEGGEKQTWSTQGSQYTYNLENTHANTMYYLYVTNKNAQVTGLSLKYEVDNDQTVATTVSINVPEGFNNDIHQGTAAGTLTATVSAGETTISGASVTWESSNANVATINESGAVTLVAVGAATITANYAGVENQYRPSSATYQLNVIDSYGPGSLNNPYTVAQARAAIDANTGVTGVYATGIVSENNYFSSNNGYITYFISADGTTESDQLEAFHGMSFNGNVFASANDIQVGDSVVVYGNLTKYHNDNTGADVYEFESGNQLVFLERPVNTEPSITLSTYEINVDDNAHQEEIEMTVANVSNDAEYFIEFYEADGTTELEDDPDWLSPTVYEGTVLCIVSLNSTTEARTAYFKVAAYVDSELLVSSNLVTVNQAAYVAPFEESTYSLATSIESGKTYIIVGLDGDNAYAMGEQKTNNRAGVAISVDGNTATVTSADVYEFVISLEGTDVYSIYDGKEEGYLYASSSSSNQLKTESSLDENGNGKWSISIDNDGIATITAQGSNSRKLMRFNPNNGSPLFACYATNSSTGSLPRLYVKNETPATEDFYRIIDEYSSGADGWYLIASPVTVDIENNSMVSGDYDLYRYNPTANLVWENYKNNQHSDFTTLEVGRGYLYANGNDGGTILTFTGVPYSGDGQITMPYEGLNLVGNPFGVEATANKPYYKMNDAHTEVLITPSSENIDVAEGVFVSASQAGDIVTFTPADKKSNNSKSAMVMNLSRNSSIVDRAIVRFGNDNTLPKFQLFENSTKLYIAQDGEEFAIVGAEEQGEMPVNFKASENGSYTISINTENVEMGYLHLIDNLTGNDVDLLTTPSYTFNAKTDDYASRFRVVFSANGNESNDSFAFVSNGQIIVNGQGTVQVYDVTGRMISSHNDVNHITTEGMTAGVYVIRLNNGNDVKTQRIVVK